MFGACWVIFHGPPDSDPDSRIFIVHIMWSFFLHVYDAHGVPQCIVSFRGLSQCLEQNLTLEKSQGRHKAWHVTVAHFCVDHTRLCSAYNLAFQSERSHSVPLTLSPSHSMQCFGVDLSQHNGDYLSFYQACWGNSHHSSSVSNCPGIFYMPAHRLRDLTCFFWSSSEGWDVQSIIPARLKTEYSAESGLS